MINLFRKTRKNIVAGNSDESGVNRLLKHMRYAIGDNVLVAIGILRTLSINPFNQTINPYL